MDPMLRTIDANRKLFLFKELVAWVDDARASWRIKAAFRPPLEMMTVDAAIQARFDSICHDPEEEKARVIMMKTPREQFKAWREQLHVRDGQTVVDTLVWKIYEGVAEWMNERPPEALVALSGALPYGLGFEPQVLLLEDLDHPDDVIVFPSVVVAFSRVTVTGVMLSRSRIDPSQAKPDQLRQSCFSMASLNDIPAVREKLESRLELLQDALNLVMSVAIASHIQDALEADALRAK